METQAPAQRGAGLAHRAAHRFSSKQRGGGAADPLEIDARPCEEWPRRRVDFRWRDRPGRDQTRRGEGKNAAPRWLSHRGPSDALPSASPSVNAARTVARWRRPYGRRLNRAPCPGPLGKRVLQHQIETSRRGYPRLDLHWALFTMSSSLICRCRRLKCAQCSPAVKI